MQWVAKGWAGGGKPSVPCRQCIQREVASLWLHLGPAFAMELDNYNVLNTIRLLQWAGSICEGLYYSIFLICGFVYNLYLSECGQRPRTSWRFWTEPRSRTSRPRRRFPTSGATSPKISAKLFKHPDFSWIMQFWHCDNFDTVLQQVLIVDCLPCDSTAATIYLISTSLLFSSPSCILMMILYLSI